MCLRLLAMHQNLWWALGYNAIAFPLVAGVLYLRTEAEAALFRSTPIVAINALMLRRTKLAGIRRERAAATPAAPALAKAGGARPEASTSSAPITLV